MYERALTVPLSDACCADILTPDYAIYPACAVLSTDSSIVQARTSFLRIPPNTTATADAIALSCSAFTLIIVALQTNRATLWMRTELRYSALAHSLGRALGLVTIHLMPILLLNTPKRQTLNELFLKKGNNQHCRCHDDTSAGSQFTNIELQITNQLVKCNRSRHRGRIGQQKR